MKHFNRMVNIVLYTIVFFVLSASIGSYIYKKPILLSVIRSSSMYPILKRGDIVIIKWVNKNSPIHIGDIILFKNNVKENYSYKDWVMHRVVGGNSKVGYLTKGDFNKQTDQLEANFQSIKKEWIGGNAITIGKYPLKIPLLGYLPLWFENFRTKPYILPVICLILVVIISISEIKGNKKSSHKSNNLEPQLIYFFSGLTIMVIVAASMLTNSQKIYIQYEVTSNSRGIIMGSSAGILKLGDKVEKPLIDLQNKAFLPITATITSNDPQITFNHDVMALKAKQQNIKTTFKINALKIGKNRSSIWIGMFYPFVPKRVIYFLAKINFFLAIVVLSLIPSVPIMLFPIFDAKSRRKTKNVIRRKLRRIKRAISFTS